MLENGLIQESRSPWASPVVLVDKDVTSTRFCVNYQKINDVPKKDRYPLPRVDDSLDLLSGNLFFSSLDLQSGFYQVLVAAPDVEKTAFITRSGLCEFLVMPLGLCNAPSTFQRAMDGGSKVEKLSSNTLQYDVLVYSKDFDTHLKDLELVF